MKLTQRPYRPYTRLDWQFVFFCIIVCAAIATMAAGIVFVTNLF